MPLSHNPPNVTLQTQKLNYEKENIKELEKHYKLSIGNFFPPAIPRTRELFTIPCNPKSCHHEGQEANYERSMEGQTGNYERSAGCGM